MYVIRLKAPEDACLLAEVTRSITEESDERIMHGFSMDRVFVRAGDKRDIQMSPGDEIEVAEFSSKHKSLKDLLAEINAEREEEIHQMMIGGPSSAREAVMPELRGETQQ